MILRKEKHDNKYTVIDNKALQDNSISWKAKGVLSYLLSLPDDWKIYLEELTEHTTDGITATRSAVQELIKAGYITRNQLKDDKGRFDSYEYVIHETKKEPKLGFPLSDELISDNLMLQSTNSTKYPLNKDTYISASAEKENDDINEENNAGFGYFEAGDPEINNYLQVFQQELGKPIMAYAIDLEIIKKFIAAGLTPEEYRQAIREQKKTKYTVSTIKSTENFALNFKKPKHNSRHKQANPNLSNFSGIWNSQSRDAKIRLLKDMKARGILEPGDELEAIEVGLLEEENG